jgi:hypothetical protein
LVGWRGKGAKQRFGGQAGVRDTEQDCIERSAAEVGETVIGSSSAEVDVSHLMVLAAYL